MDMSKLPDDHFVTSHQFTRKAYRDQYPSIDPASPALSQAGKVVVVITGASKGIGRQGLAPAFARANAKAIVLVARNAEQLAEVEKEFAKINDQVKVVGIATDLVDETSVDAFFEKIKAGFGAADVLVNNAGTSSGVGPIADSDTKKWWGDFEVNVRGTYLVTKGFLRLIGSDKAATIVNISTGAAVGVAPGMPGYAISKLAITHLQHVSPVDSPRLIGGFAVWLATDKAKFMNGRYAAANWSVDELLERKDEIVNEGKLLTGFSTKLGVDQFK
ncbi:MAG: hypothetical protein M1815_000660 [Lichina confinis]|nr:MAG: hypothetical protein M1815_000660 [Lichina confinis]